MYFFLLPPVMIDVIVRINVRVVCASRSEQSMPGVRHRVGTHPHIDAVHQASVVPRSCGHLPLSPARNRKQTYHIPPPFHGNHSFYRDYTVSTTIRRCRSINTIIHTSFKLYTTYYIPFRSITR